MSLRTLRTQLTALLLTVSCSAIADTQVLDLSNRTSTDLLPVAQNFIGKDGTVSAYGNQLIVNAAPGKIQGLRALLSQLDTPARRLLITVDTNENNQQSSGDSQTRIISYGTTSRDGGVQQIQASEGVPALIQVGQSVPLTTTQPDAYGRPQNQTQYRNVTQGFYVTASVTGETVHLAISTNRDRMSQERPDVVNVQSTDTTVSGRLGEWIPLAGINRQTQADKTSTTRSYSTQGRDDLTLRVKVDSVN
ncbi:secretin N-terminal domain-containing protein [Pseudomonas sp. ICMP 460]|uniref:secretin N-terminal domain-containing protein n=1 Tax=Pseudomonas sp. ICMP 460 TaxID=1718917 RepID=UPI000C088988|nr:secretin N-terminal domain-containing protein [Pseudomonas sp. ICMP 460]PHN20291.1 secretin [Pseudomonas sp. ICMP 460]